MLRLDLVDVEYPSIPQAFSVVGRAVDLDSFVLFTELEYHER